MLDAPFPRIGISAWLDDPTSLTLRPRYLTALAVIHARAFARTANEDGKAAYGSTWTVKHIST